MIQAVTFIGILGGMLWVVSICSAFYKYYPMDGWAILHPSAQGQTRRGEVHPIHVND